MPIRASSIRLFVSSTFSDFRREREILDTLIFPKLQRYCADRGYQFQPIDLRWGIGEEDARSQQTLRVCLNEVTRCIQTSLQPCFLALVGGRYGWQPLPNLIPDDEYRRIVEALRQEFPASRLALLERWYRLDRNQIPPHRVLQPRSGSLARDPHRWRVVEEELRSALRAGASAAGLSAETRDKYFLSATAQEIARGVFDTQAHAARPDFRQHVLCFVRRRLGIPPATALPPDTSFNDIDAAGELDTEAAERLAALVARVQSVLGDNVLVYQEFVGPGGDSGDYEAAFAANAERLLGRLVQNEISRLEQLRDDEQEWLRHDAFGQDRAALVLGREDLIGRVDAFLDQSGGRGLIVHGVGGIGKSTLVAKAASMASDTYRGLFVVQRYVGATASASAGHSLLAGLLRQLAGPGSEIGRESPDLAQLGRDLRRRLADVAATRPRGVLLALDALDQLPRGDPARSLDWLPWPAPAGVAVLISTVDGELLDALRRRMVGADSIRIGPLPAPAGRDVLRSLLRESDRCLERTQEDHVLRLFGKEGSPLYLRVAAFFARRWAAYDGQRVRTPHLPMTTVALIRRFFTELSGPGGHAPLLVSNVCGLLAASKQGLTESELLALLWEDESYRRLVEANNRANDLPPLRNLPVIFWSRLRDDLASFLVERGADGTAALTFFHRIFDEAVAQAFLPTEASRAKFRRALIRHFRAEPLFLGRGDAKRPNLRKLSELPHQLIGAGDVDGLFELLSREDYFLAKLAAHRGEEYYREVYACASMMKPGTGARGRARLVGVLARHVRALVARRATARYFSAEELHVSLVYLDVEGIFYKPFLQACLRKLASGRGARAPEARKVGAILGVRLANLYRRAGQHHRARADLGKIMPLLRRWKLFVEVSRAEYDLAYIDRLGGNFATAARLFLVSAESARLGGNEVSEAISRCVAAYSAWIDAISQRVERDASPRFLAELDRAEDVFQRHVALDSNALRWIFNVRLHRFRVGFRLGDLHLAQQAVDQSLEDPWVEAYGQLDAYAPALLARLELMRGNHAEGARRLRRLIETSPPTTESILEDYFDAGMAYIRIGRKRIARNLWRRALTIDRKKRFGNEPWRQLIRSAMPLTQ
ncbi:AAA family ATPase [Tahibacter caeni]|uniref:AAA family ATPase n=1 Tax=Tahibacter caeni TaxID=1453545 RepID=UPI002147EDCF|nr:AAA family ATPase [Tahibacter caeni]